MNKRSFIVAFVTACIIAVFSLTCFATSDISDYVDLLPSEDITSDVIVITPEEFEESRINIEVSPTPVVIDNSDLLQSFSQDLNSAFAEYNSDYFALLPLLEKYEFVVIDSIENFYFLRCNNEYFILSHYDLISLGRLYE